MSASTRGHNKMQNAVSLGTCIPRHSHCNADLKRVKAGSSSHSTMTFIQAKCVFLGLAFLLVGLEAAPQGRDIRPPTDLLYLDSKMIVELPSFTPFTSCPVDSYPVPASGAVTDVLNKKVLACGGKIIRVRFDSLQQTKIQTGNILDTTA